MQINCTLRKVKLRETAPLCKSAHTTAAEWNEEEKSRK